jgi:hypothetical protein
VSAAPQRLTTVALAAHGFAVDRVTAEVTGALGAAGVPSILLKGPALATWLYAGDEARLYGDTDLLLRAADWGRAQELLAGLGFEDDLGPLAHPRMESGEGYPWWRPRDEASVDLHLTLFGVGAGFDAIWEAFSRGAVRGRVGGAGVPMPSFEARLLHVALHAVQHGGDASPKAMTDLERALEMAPVETWEGAHQMALELDAAATFAAGLRLTAAGRELAAALGAEAGDSGAARLRMAKVPLAEGFAELAAAPGARAKLVLLARELFPTPAFMRWWTPLARRGRLGLALSYPWRWLWLASRALPGYRAWRRER